MKNEFFKTVYDEDTDVYTVYFKKNPKKVLTNVDNAYMDTAKHIKIEKDGKWTLYDLYGNPEKHAQNVDSVSYSNDNFYKTSKGTYYTRQGQIRTAAIYTGVTLAGFIAALAILGDLTKCANDDIQEREALEKTPATYLGGGELSFFDTDGNKKTTEVVAYQSSDTENVVKRFDANIQPGETRLISEWRDLGFFQFERVKQDKQNTR